MTGHAQTWMDSAYGYVHTGTGDQNFYGTVFADLGSLFRNAARPDPRRIAKTELDRLRASFVAPPELDLARRMLGSACAVLLLGRPGSGRTTTAKMLLEDDTEGVLIRQLLDQEEEGEGIALDPEQIESGGRYLLDLSAVEEDRFRVFMGELSTAVEELPDKGARLCIVAPWERRTSIPPALQPLRVDITAPPRPEVLKKHLLTNGSEVDPQVVVGSPPIRERLQNATLHEVSHLAEELVRTRRHRGESDGELLARVLTGEASSAAALVDVLETGRQRAVLLARCLLPDARAESVLDAAEDLADAAAEAGEPVPVLERRPLSRQLDDLVGLLHAGGDTASPGQVRRENLTEAHFAEAVTDHFWDQFQALRPQIARWAQRLVHSGRLEPAENTAFVGRFVRLALRTSPELLDKAVKAWTDGRRPDFGLPAAGTALEAAVVDPRRGSTFRRLLYDWATLPGLPRERAQVVLGVCTGTMATLYQRQAMVRLHHLSRQRDPQIAEVAREALLTSTSDAAWLQRALLSRLAPADPRHGSADAALFTAFAEPERLTGGRQRPRISEWFGNELTRCWADVLAGHPQGSWEQSARAWLRAAAPGRPRASTLLAILVHACGRDGTRHALLYALAADVEREDGARRGLAAHFLTESRKHLGLSCR